MDSILTENLQDLSNKLTSLEQILVKPDITPLRETSFVLLLDPQTFIVNNTTIHFIRGDITTLNTQQGIQVDAIVNAADKSLVLTGGVSGAIFRAAGLDKLMNYIKKQYRNGIRTGEAITTPSFNLQNTQNVNYIIHAVGPIFANYTPEEAARLLKDAYVNSLIVADQHTIHSIAFPFISSAIYGYPPPAAANVALNAVIDYVNKHNDTSITDIYFILFFDKDLEIFKAELQKVYNN